jgi:hypothetical protein
MSGRHAKEAEELQVPALVKKLREQNKPSPLETYAINDKIKPKKGVLVIGENGEPIAAPQVEIVGGTEPKRMTRQ